MNQLKLGDHLKSVNSKGDVVFPPFLGWLHRDENVTTTFIDITTKTGKSLSLTPHHLLMVTENVDKAPAMTFAHHVREGHYLWSAESGPTKVKSVASKSHVGIFAPLTSTGTFLVDDLLVSCYAHLSSHAVAHLAFLPFRTFPHILKDEVRTACFPE